ncbi:MAG: hypothetical protein ABR595_05280 [Psychroflexus sp.]
MTESLIYTITGIISAVLTFVLHNKYHFSNVKASALPALILGLGFYFCPNLLSAPLNQQIPIVFFGASFAGMASGHIAKHYLVVAISGAIFAIVYQNSAEFFDGLGGTLGATAFVSIMAAVGASSLLKNKRFGKQNKSEKH